MSTNNDASQTLFRFVSLRNPELTETKKMNFGFIHRPEEVIGIFDTAIADRTPLNTKISALETNIKSNNFASVAFGTEKEIETSEFNQLLIIGIKISKKEKPTVQDWKYTKSYYKNLIKKNKALNSKGLKIYGQLWNNLIYQVVTQKDFYVKEAISHILKAIHLGFVQSVGIDESIIKVNGEKPLEKALDAKIVLPTALFMDGISDSSTSIIDATTLSNSLSPVTVQRLTNEAKTDILVKEASYKKESLLKLGAELKQIQKSYYKQRSKVYDENYATYIKKVQPKIDEFEKINKEIESLVEEKAQNSKITQLNEDLLKIEIPTFEFIYKSEINTADLKSNLSPESLHLFLDLFSNKVQNIAVKANSKEKVTALSPDQIQFGDQVFELDDTIETYNAAINEIDNQIALQTQTVLQNSTLVQEQYINLGGALIPVAQNSLRTPLAYSFTAILSKSVEMSAVVAFSFEVENASWNIVNAKIIADTDSGYIEENYSNILVINNKVTLPTSLINKFQIINNFRVEIIFDNGKEAFMELSEIPNNVTLTGMHTLKKSLPTVASKRKNFGIKRIGVADYLKVVQSVHAYVPGLVSNIENVMASELRHKSSVSREYSEITDTTSKYQETEKVSDTSKTSRTDMQSEVARELDKQRAITGHTRFNYDSGMYKFEIGAEYANNTAQHDSTRQAVMKSQEITEKAMDRVLTKISEERIQKIIKEYTETNVHEFDNRGKVTETNNPEAAQPKHITGVYRWIDIKYKNQIYNYGIRTMFEFMVPEPAKLHRLALSVAKGQILTAPIDPRKAEGELKMTDPKTASKEHLQYWAEIYKVELTESLPSTKQITHQAISRPDTDNDFGPDFTRFDIPENYNGKNARFIC
jgi:hypothetical protein